MPTIAIAAFLFLLSLEERYNEGIDRILTTSSKVSVTFEPTLERIDDQFFAPGSLWQKQPDADDMTTALDFIELAGYSRDLEGFIEANEYEPLYFSWTDFKQNELNLVRSMYLAMSGFPFIEKAYYYEESGDITHIYLKGNQFYNVLYETESTVMSVYFINHKQ